MFATPKRHIPARNCVFWRILRRNPSGALGCTEIQEPKKQTRNQYVSLRDFEVRSLKQNFNIDKTMAACVDVSSSVVFSSLLCFVRTKFKTLEISRIKSTIVDFFSAEDICSAKRILLQSVSNMVMDKSLPRYPERQGSSCIVKKQTISWTSYNKLTSASCLMRYRNLLSTIQIATYDNAENEQVRGHFVWRSDCGSQCAINSGRHCTWCQSPEFGGHRHAAYTCSNQRYSFDLAQALCWFCQLSRC